MNEIFATIGPHRRRVSVGYTLPNGKVVRMFRKLDGNDHDAIIGAINDVKSIRGVQAVTVEIYRPNGSAEKLDNTFNLPVGQITNAPVKSVTSTNLGSTGSLFEDQPTRVPVRSNSSATPSYTATPKPTTQKVTTMESQGWKDYALRTEQDKNAKLEREVADLKSENKALDLKVRDFEKEMIKKDHEIEKLTANNDSKNGLNGVVEKITANPQAMGVAAMLLGKAMGLDPGHMAGMLGGGQASCPEDLHNRQNWKSRQRHSSISAISPDG